MINSWSTDDNWWSTLDQMMNNCISDNEIWFVSFVFDYTCTQECKLHDQKHDVMLFVCLFIYLFVFFTHVHRIDNNMINSWSTDDHRIRYNKRMICLFLFVFFVFVYTGRHERTGKIST